MNFKLIIIFFLILLTACVPPGTRPINKSADDSSIKTRSTPNAPNFENTTNYFQEGGIKSYSSIQLRSDFNNNLSLRGKDVHTFITNGQTTKVQCLLAYFPSSLDKKILVVAAIPRSFENFQTATQEYYYHLIPSDETMNQSNCKTPGVLNEIDSKYYGVSSTNKLINVCPSCNQEQYLYSEKIELLSTGGSPITQFDVSYLGLTILSNPYRPTSNAPTCSISADCLANSYDCCSYGQCVNDKQIKDGVNQSSSEYIQAAADVLVNSENFRNYPDIYHICGTYVAPTPTPTPTVSPDEQARIRLLELEELYNCTTLIQGSMSICTTTYGTIGSTLSGTYYTNKDDRSFSSTYSGSNSSVLSGDSLYEISFADKLLYSNQTIITSGSLTISDDNDNVADKTKIVFNNYPLPSSSSNSDLKIKYMIDGSCKKINSSFASCSQYYTQGQDSGKIDDHSPASNTFKLPYYVDITRSIKVEIEGDKKMQGTDWNLSTSGSNYTVEFSGPELGVFDLQKAKITFYVNLSTYPYILKSRQASYDRIDEICNCGNTECWLQPAINSNNQIFDYTCKYINPNLPTAPTNTTVSVSAKTAPHRFFDDNGIYYTTIQPGMTQEGNEFKYPSYSSTGLQKPNNITTDVGFNEIYGSFSLSSESAKPAVEVKIEKDKSYDIYVDSGTFSTCYYCGTDYYSYLAKLFPSNFTSRGAGYTPDLNISSKSQSKIYRGDDLLFGRACFVPVTMIPWTHKGISSTSSAQTQRLRRLQTQHFLFANGYQRDWYGFNYGSVIGSFDGVKWFSIGNRRRIKATTSKLFIAINSYFGDLTTNSNFSVKIIDTTLNPVTQDTITANSDSEGATCQQNHQCKTDNDCISQLGWDYTCQNVTKINTPWPTFDNSANEIPSGDQSIRLSLLAEFNSGDQPKRCVYRGRGSPCEYNYNTTDISRTYDGTDTVGLHGCNSNNYCQSFDDNGTVSKFNTRISRYGTSIKNLNAREGTNYHSFGLGSPVIGRPLNYNGTEKPDSDILSQLANNNLTALCIPGKVSNNWGLTLLQQMRYIPTSDFQGDQVSGIGMSSSGNSPSSEYLNSCSIVDEDENYFAYDSDNTTKSLTDSELTRYAGSQSLPTNSLKIFESLMGGSIKLLSDFSSERVDNQILQENRCLRAPGSVCFSDMDCSANDFITKSISSLNSNDSSLYSSINKYEISFWKEKLICSQSDSPDHTFDIKENRCCRETNKTLTIPSYDLSSDLYYNDEVPGIETDLSDPKRYSGNSVVYKELKDGTLPTLTVAYDNECASGNCLSTSAMKNQFNTFSKMAERMCCTGNWVRNFHEDNGGGHKWNRSKTQNIDLESFRCLNWNPCTGANCGGSTTSPKYFSCEHVADNPDSDLCLQVSTSSNDAESVFNWLDRFELMGIPQTQIQATGNSEVMCKVDVNDQSQAGTNTIFPRTIGVTPTNSNTEYTDGTNIYFSGTDSSNFDQNLKMIFSKDQISCCIPGGDFVSATDSADKCCTGFKNADNRCVLDDYTDVSLFFNRYVSSASKGIADDSFEEDSGYAKKSIGNPSPEIRRYVCEKQICASNTMATGVAYSTLKKPGINEGAPGEVSIKRFLDGRDPSNNYSSMASYFDSGLKWNTHIYCVPNDIEEDPDNNLQIFRCE